MNKKITLGAASIALAAMPVAGVFAAQQTSTITDTLNAKVLSACEFTRTGVAGSTVVDTTVGEIAPSWDGPSAGTGHTYSATIKPSTDVELGTSTFTGYCNDAAGFTVTVVTPSLVDGTKSIAFAGATNPGAGEGWTLTRALDGSAAALFANATGDTFMNASAPTDAATAKTATATYTVYTSSTTKSGNYSGDVVYTFTYNE